MVHRLFLIGHRAFLLSWKADAGDFSYGQQTLFKRKWLSFAKTSSVPVGFMTRSVQVMRSFMVNIWYTITILLLMHNTYLQLLTCDSTMMIKLEPNKCSVDSGSSTFEEIPFFFCLIKLQFQITTRVAFIYIKKPKGIDNPLWARAWWQWEG